MHPHKVSRHLGSGGALHRRAAPGVYDLLVGNLANSYAWRCDRERVLALYQDNMSARHLDVGPGTGWYLERSVTAGSDVTLMDTNSRSLHVAGKRLVSVGAHVSVVEADAREPLPRGLSGFGSVGLTFVVQGLPGDWKDKGLAFTYLAAGLRANGVLFGATVLGRCADRNLVAAALLVAGNSVGAFHNSGDDEQGLRAALERAFHQVEVRVVGAVALFAARVPRR